MVIAWYQNDTRRIHHLGIGWISKYYSRSKHYNAILGPSIILSMRTWRQRQLYRKFTEGENSSMTQVSIRIIFDKLSHWGKDQATSLSTREKAGTNRDSEPTRICLHNIPHIHPFQLIRTCLAENVQSTCGISQNPRAYKCTIIQCIIRPMVCQTKVFI